MNKVFLLIVLFSICGFSQTEKDTVYIYFDSNKEGMKKSSFIDKRVVRDTQKESTTYYVDEKPTESSYLYDSGYTFWHRNRPQRDLDRWGGKLPIVQQKDTSFLNTIAPLDIDFFLNTDYGKVCRTFNKSVYGEQKVFIFIIDKDEIKDGKLTLREVRFSPPHKI